MNPRKRIYHWQPCACPRGRRDYAVFANLSISGDVIMQKYWLTSDDEDDGNLNTFLWFGQSSGDQVRAKEIVNTIRSGTSKTTYYMAAVRL